MARRAQVTGAVMATVLAGCGGGGSPSQPASAAPQFLQGWQWRVRAVDRNGTAGPWSDTRTFDFVLCRIGRRICGT